MTKAELVLIIKNYYPDYLNIVELESKYHQTPEFNRLAQVCRKGEENIEVWKKFESKVKDKLDKKYYIQDWSHLINNNPCYRLRITYPSSQNFQGRIREVMVLVSLITPLYAIYISELDHFPESKKYSLPIIGFKENPNDNLYLYELPEITTRGRIKKELIEKYTKEFFRNNEPLEIEVFKVIKKSLFEIFNRIEFMPMELINEIIPGVTNFNNLQGETTYFDCLFTDHVF